jgi:DNA-binding transcriptional ArsR family regulator
VNPAIVNFFEYNLYSTMRLTKGECAHIFNYMVEYMRAERLSKLLKAVSDTTRRDLLTRLCQQGASRVTDLASYYDMSLNAISKHIKVLESAGLVKRTTVGRSHSDWFASLKSIWALSLEQLEKALNTGEEE